MRASSQSTNASNRSDFPPETRNRSRAAATLFGCSANTRSPASSSRSTSSPSGRSIATSTTSIRTSIRHSALSALLVVRVRRRSAPPRPSRRPRARRASPTPSRSRHTDTPSPPPPVRSPSQRPDPEVPLRVLIDKALEVGATSCCRLRHLTTVGTGWSLAGPPQRASNRGPLPAAVEATTACPMSAGARGRLKCEDDRAELHRRERPEGRSKRRLNSCDRVSRRWCARDLFGVDSPEARRAGGALSQQSVMGLTVVPRSLAAMVGRTLSVRRPAPRERGVCVAAGWWCWSPGVASNFSWSGTFTWHGAQGTGVHGGGARAGMLRVFGGRIDDHLVIAGADRPKASVRGAAGMIDVACPSVHLCVGTQARGVEISTNPLGGASTWAITALPVTPGTPLGSISCASRRLCVAVSGRRPGVHLNGPDRWRWRLEGDTRRLCRLSRRSAARGFGSAS